ncbi:MAG: BrnT family toxin [Cyanobacteria bacterium J06581_3]
MKFEWDSRKNKANVLKHNLDFTDASKVFRLPLRISLDKRQDYGEERWIGLGVLDGRVVAIVFTEPSRDTIRIISLRKALPNERKRYEQYIRDELGEG